MRARQYYVYIMSNHSRRLYIGITRDLHRRVEQHRAGTFAQSFTKRYRITQLVYFEVTGDVHAAIAREKQLKGWTREKKLQLIEAVNSGWLDLAADWPSRTP
ncbi:MAG TPA: GIY-YIG nuclease family protein [Gemmatimonadaceae bacterium]|nr:GIY-YIG nuclease family protein [Gemmatimonadaceae bacterium]